MLCLLAAMFVIFVGLFHSLTKIIVIFTTMCSEKKQPLMFSAITSSQVNQFVQKFEIVKSVYTLFL